MLKIEENIIDIVKEKGQVSIKELCRMCYDCRYIPKRETRKVINHLIEQGVFVKVYDVDCFGNRVDDIVISD